MKQADLISTLAVEANTTKAIAEQVLKSLGNVVQASLGIGEEVTLPGIGKLEAAKIPARTGRNPRTGESVEIAAKTKPKFIATKALKDALNG